jgi:hypothetical protein
MYYSSQLVFENRYERHAILAHELQRPLRLTMGHACAGKEGKRRYGSNPFATAALDGVGWGGVGWVVSTTPRPLYPPGKARYIF